LTQIITLTPNPAIDVSTSVAKMAPYTKLRGARPERHPGGGGINVARVVKRFGGAVTAIYPVGGVIGQYLHQLMDREAVSSLTIRTEDETREDFTVFEQATKQQYRIVLPGAELREPEWTACLAAVAGAKPAPEFIVASGSLPPGVPDDFFGKVARLAKKMNAKLIVDTAGAALKEALQEGVYLIKPNLREFKELTGTRATEDGALIEAGRSIINRGSVEIIAISMGPNGALLITRDHALRANGMKITPVSVVGAGDSFLGAMVWSLARNTNLDAALRYGVAAGSAALLNPGTELCRVADAERLVSQVIVRPLATNVAG
jgi:6-phosphofructokinase 2